MPTPPRTTVLARVSGLPARLWLAAANPRLARAVHDVEERWRAHHARTTVLAEVVGSELVPNPGLSTRERALVLKVRRALHNGTPVADADISAVVEVARRVGARDGLVGDLLDVAARTVELTEADRAADASLGAERDRLLRGSWDVVNGSVPARRAVRHDNPAAYHDIERRVRRGDRWTDKRLRRESEYLWRMIERGTTKPTPRGWFGHVGLVSVKDGGCAGEPDLVLGPAVTAFAVDSVYLGRHGAAGGAGDLDRWSDPSARVALTPLHRMDDQHVWVWTGHPDRAGRLGPTELVEVRLRRTSALDALVSALSGQARPVTDAVDCLLPVAGTPATAEAFLRHLAGRGLLTLTCPPATRHRPGRYATESASAPDASVEGGPARSGDRTFVDVYREVLSPLDSHWYRRVDRLVAQAGRIDALIDADHQDHDPTGLSSTPRPVLELVFDELRDPSTRDERPARHGGWPQPELPDSGYAALVERLGSTPVTRVADITPALLDAVGAPAATFEWPVDAIVRPMAGDIGLVATLDCVAPAGVLDSRFADMLTRSGGAAPGLASYREWLRRIEEETGVLFVELLLPPVSAIAANAVRRPVYTRAWTGDPDPRPYHGTSPPDYRYVPLSDITLHECDGEVVAQTAGRRIWPMYHATRTPQQPWKALYRWLMRASPQRRYSPDSLSGSGHLLAHRDAAPRITVDNALVLTPASWRVGRAGLWDGGAPALVRARALDRIRHRLGLPRWVFVTGAPGGPLACDLDSARAVGTFERVVEESPDGVIVVEEMLPDPDHFVAGDGQHPVPDRFATELLLRLPFQTGTEGGGAAHQPASEVFARGQLARCPIGVDEEVTHEPTGGPGPEARRADG